MNQRPINPLTNAIAQVMIARLISPSVRVPVQNTTQDYQLTKPHRHAVPLPAVPSLPAHRRSINPSYLFIRRLEAFLQGLLQCAVVPTYVHISLLIKYLSKSTEVSSYRNVTACQPHSNLASPLELSAQYRAATGCLHCVSAHRKSTARLYSLLV
jgi:hypothetical protein